MKPLVIYHKADFDGIFCREIARKALGDSADYLGWDYGDPVPGVSADQQVYMLDISIEQLMAIPGLVWIDHHRTAIDKYDFNVRGLQLDRVAACRLAWQFFFSTSGSVNSAIYDQQLYIDRLLSEPLSVQLAGEYDVWDKRNPDADLFQHGLRSQELTDQVWKNLLDTRYAGKTCQAQVKRLLKAGRIVEYAKRVENESIIRSNGFTVSFEGKLFLACNAARYNSHLFATGLLPQHDGCLGFNYDGTKWRVSMYGVPGKPDEDFTPIAKKYGGGGHKQACGFTTYKLPFWPCPKRHA